MQRIHLNGQPHDVPDGATVAWLLESLGLERPGVAVAIDQEVVPRSDHTSTELPANSNVEVIRAVGGG